MNSNESEILASVAKAIFKVESQLAFNDSELLNFPNIIKVYSEVLKLIHYFPNDIDLFSPLLKLLDHPGWEEFHKEIVCLLSIVGLEHLTNPMLFPKMMNILQNNEAITKISNLSHGASKINLGARSLGLSELNLALLKLDIAILASKCLVTLNKFVHLRDVQSLINTVMVKYEFEPWQSLVNFLVEDNELISIMVAQTPNFFTQTIQYPEINFLKEVVVNVLSSDHYHLIPNLGKPKLNFLTVAPSNINLETSFKTLSSILDHGILKLKNEKTLVVYVNWCLNQIIAYTELPQGKADIHSIFNSLRPVISISAFFQKLAVILLKEKRSELPPISKPGWMLDDWIKDIDEFPDFRSSNVCAANKSLLLVSLFIADDLSMFLDVKDPIMLKCYLSRVNSIFEILNSKLNEMQPLVPNLVTILENIDSPLIWAHIVSLVQDLCYRDLKLVKICNLIFLQLADKKSEFIKPFVERFGGSNDLNRIFNLPPVKYVEFQQSQ